VIGIGQDITARIAQEREYENLIDTANAPIFGIDLDGVINVWNKTASNITGFSTEDVLGCNLVKEFIHADYQKSVQTVLNNALKGFETSNFEFPLGTIDGNRVDILLNASSRRDDQGNIVGVIGIGQDITARIAQEREYEKLIDTANAPIFGIDKEGVVNVWNQKACDVTSYTKEDVIGKKLVEEFITDDYKVSVQQVLSKALEGVEMANFEFPIITKNEKRVEILLNATSRRDASGFIVGVIGIGQDITARIAQEREYERLIDTANAPIFGIDVSGVVNVWNKTASKITGYSHEDVMGRRLVQDYITSDYQHSVQNVLNNAFNGWEMANFEFPLITKWGKRVEILLNATSRRDEMGTIIGVIGIGQDITARIAQEREYEKLIDTANAPIFGIDLDGVVNVWNQKASDTTGYTKEEVLGHKLVEEYITDDYKDSVQEVLNKALEGDEMANFEFPLITNYGKRVDILLNATSRRDEKGSIIGVIGIGQDITARIAQEREYEKLIDTANAPIFGIDLEGVVNVWNQKACDVTKYTKDDVIGQKLVEEFITDDYKNSVQEVLTNALNGSEIANFEFPIVTKEGKQVDILLNATTRRDETGAIIGVIGIGQDITARIAQEREYIRLIDTANAPIFGIDIHGVVNVWNKTASNITGFSQEDVIGHKLVEEFITADYQESVQNVLCHALEGREMANFEFPIISSAGKRIDILLNATSRRDETGTIVGVIGIGQDITARIAQEREYEKLIDTANAPIFGIDVDGVVNVWNQKASDVTGYTKTEVLGQKLVEEYITDDFKTSVQEVLDKALMGIEMANYEFPIITSCGQQVDILLNATSRRDETGSIIGVIGIGQDITARIAQEKEYERLIDTANAPIFGINVHGIVNVWNHKACDVTYYPKEDVIGRKLVEEFITDDYKVSVQEVLTQALEGREMANFEFPIITKRGKRVDILLNATSRRDETGNIVGVIGIGQDITARIAQEREYEKLIDTANAPIFGIDRHGVVNVWNKTASNITGFSGEEVMGRKLVEDFIQNDFQDSVQNVFTNALDGLEMANFEFPIMTKAKKRVDILLNATSRRDETGAIVGVIGIGQDITARIAQEREYEKLIDTANAPIFGIDKSGIVNVWNQKASIITGFYQKDVIGKKLVEEFITADYQQSVQNVFDNALEGLEMANFEFPIMTTSGNSVDILLNATSRRDETGTIIGVIGIGQDITARIAQEREYIRLIETANAPIFGIDVNGVVNVWNLTASNITGFSTDDVMGHKLVEEFITEDYQDSVQNVLGHALEGHEMANFEFPIITKSGKRVDILLNATSRRDETGTIIGVIGIGQDITARIAQEREYIRLIDTANAPIFGIDCNGVVNVWNRTASNITGFTTAEVMGRNLVEEYITDDYKQAVQKVLDSALEGEETANYELPLMTKEGKRVEILLNATSRRDEHGNVIGVVGIGQDITEIRAAREYELKKIEAEAAEAAQRTVSAHVYHEIRNVVGAVLALADRACECVDLAIDAENENNNCVSEATNVLATKIRQLTEHQRTVCQHAVDTLNDMLDVAKLEAGTFIPKTDVVDLTLLCHEAMQLQGPRLRFGVSWKLNVPPQGQAVVYSDRVLLLQFLTNLLSNAAKFTWSGGVSVECNLRDDPERKDCVIARVGVSDSGPGIPAEDQERVLDAFTTGSAVPREDFDVSTRNTGCGLRLADLIVKALGRTVCLQQKVGINITSPVEPDHPAHIAGGGAGCFLFLELPFLKAESEETAAAAEDSQQTHPLIQYELSLEGRLKVLVVDDQRTMRQMMAMLFQRLAQQHVNCDVEVTTALSAEEATRIAKLKQFHIITMDEQLSEEYCLGVGQRASPDHDNWLPQSMVFTNNKHNNAKLRSQFFENEIKDRPLQTGDGKERGHIAIKKIREFYHHQEPGSLQPILFNVTGNVLDDDRNLYLESGSDGVLAKPTNFTEFTLLLENSIHNFVLKEYARIEDDKVIMNDGCQIAKRSVSHEAHS